MTDPTPVLTLLYRDAAVVAVDKPAGITVTPSPRPGDGPCLRDQLVAALSVPVWVVHRIDRETSGVVIFALTAAAHRALSMTFEARRAAKRYLAFTAGCPSPRAAVIDTPLHEGRKGRMRPAQPGEHGAVDARTSYEVRQTWRHGGDTVSLVEARPETGRHHQIRVHLRSVGAPLLGDSVYGRQAHWPEALLASQRTLAPRLALHAVSLQVPHPDTGAPLVLEAALPGDLVALSAYLDAAWQRDTPA